MQAEVWAKFSCPVGRIKPMHGLNNAPFYGCDDSLFPALTAASIPYARLHDTGGRYGGHVYVDIANIFRDENADPADPAAYDFAFTDWLLAALHKAGVQPFYRLGATIENDHRVRAYHIFPPKDPHRWAEICDGIIRHYNEGWANGFHYGIRYWEIWNEPDNEPLVADNPMWKGSMEDFFVLYEVTANLLKQRHPDLKIGGYASCGFYAILNAHAAVANSSPRTDYFLEFFEKFLTHITTPGHTAPLDFFSWHSYSGIEENLQYAAYARQRLDAFGLQATESILNEWNPGIQNRGKPLDAAQICGMMAALQNASVDMLTYYDGQINSYNGLWDPITRRPFWGYYAFAAFGALYRLGRQVAAGTDTPALRVVAATADGQGAAQGAAILLVNNTGADCQVRLRLEGLPGGAADASTEGPTESQTPVQLSLGRIDAAHTLADAPQQVTLQGRTLQSQTMQGQATQAQTLELALPVDGIVLLTTQAAR